MPPGEYRLVLNVIDTASGSPITTRRADGSIGGLDWPLGLITIDPAQNPIDPATRRPPIVLNDEAGGLTAIGTGATRPDHQRRSVGTIDGVGLNRRPTARARCAVGVDQNDRVVYSTTLPLNSYSTEHWRKGEVLQSKYDFRVPISVRRVSTICALR
jgi:hypothetical protein